MEIQEIEEQELKLFIEKETGFIPFPWSKEAYWNFGFRKIIRENNISSVKQENNLLM